MKSYRAKKQRPELSYEAMDLDLGHRVKKEVKSQISEAKNDVLGQLGINSAFSSETAFQNPSEGRAIDQSLTSNNRKEKGPGLNKGIIFDFTAQLLGKNSFINTEQGISKAESRIEPGIEYHSEYFRSIRRVSENLSGRETGEQSQRIKQIMTELKKLVASTKALQIEFGQINVETVPSTPGKYYINFFDWLFIMIKQARQKAEDSKAWLDTLKGKTKKLNYWGMAKKQGTSFTQNNERSVATSTG